MRRVRRFARWSVTGWMLASVGCAGLGDDGRAEPDAVTPTARPARAPEQDAEFAPGAALEVAGEAPPLPLVAPPAERKERARRETRAMAGGAKKMAVMGPAARAPEAVPNTEAYDTLEEHDFVAVADDPLSTFSIDVDTASYANVRRFLRDGSLPPASAVRIEELVNYFSYEYAPPKDQPFSMHAEVSPCPWNEGHLLAHVGLQGQEIDQAQVPARNLVFLLDVSGSMVSPDKLPLLKRGLGLLVENLRPQDHVAVVVYAGASGVVLEPTSGADKARILEALERLEAGGSTNGGAGIELAYALAAKTFRPGGINRVILATDGDFNVGTTSEGELVSLIERKRESGVFLSVLGFGTGNLKDATMEKLADKGNGNYAYIDGIHEAKKVLVEEAGATLVTIAKDVKIQVEFNPAQVASYRLLGYENRALADATFDDDRKDAGEIGAGHSVTALYELVPAGSSRPTASALRYQTARDLSPAAASAELMNVKIRYKAPHGERSDLLTFPVRAQERALAESSRDHRFAAAVAGFGMLLRDSKHKADLGYDDVLRLARGALDQDPHGYRAEFIALVETAARLGSTRRP